MRYLVIFSIMILSSAPSVLFPGGYQAIKGAKVGFSPIPFEWDGWDRDADLDGVDDLLDTDIPARDWGGDRIGINVHVLDNTDNEKVRLVMETAEYLGMDPVLLRRGTHSNALYLLVDGSDPTGFAGLASLEEVEMVEYRPVFRSSLEVSAPSLRASPSEEYSPLTAWELGYTGEGVNIAVMDSGADDTVHESLRGKYVWGGDFTGTTTIVGLNPDDVDGHGTHVSGIALGNGGNSGTYSGLAPDSELVDLKIFKVYGGDAGNSDAAFEWLIDNHEEHGVRVVSCSFGSTYTSSGSDTTSRLVNRLVEEGVVVVVAAGNDGSRGFPSPAAADGAITVGAVDDSNTVDRLDDWVAGYSNRGPRANDGDMNDLDELKPDVVAPGTNIISSEHNSFYGYVSKTGTSMAAPHISGLVALMLEAYPDLTPTQVKEILRDTAQQRYDPSEPSLDAKYNYRSGWGLADAYGAVKRASDIRSFSIEGPQQVSGGEEIVISMEGSFTATTYDEDGDDVEMTMWLPASLEPTSAVDVESGSGSAEVSVGDPVFYGEYWEVRARIDYTGPVEQADVRMELSVKAPREVGVVSTINGLASVNSIEGEPLVHVVTVTSEAPPADLSVIPTAIWFSDGRPETGEEITIQARINNTGGTRAPDTLVRIFDGPELSGEMIGESRVDVPAGGHALVGTGWVANPGVHAITVVADADDRIEEENELNNSAERPLTVLGLNPPPMAVLTAEPSETNTLKEVTFDGSSSYDTNLRGGTVTSYRFDFGDGDGTGWINRSVVVHRYVDGGAYTASLQVRDNGGAVSSNDAEVDINVTEVESESLLMYLNPDRSLSEGPGQRDALSVSEGEEPERIGTWASRKFEKEIVLHSEIKLTVELECGGEASLDASAMLSTSDWLFDMGRFEDARVNGSGVLVLTSRLDHLEVALWDSISMEVYISANTSDCSMVLGESLTTLELSYFFPEDIPPEAQAGKDKEVRANEEVVFLGSARDPDGEVVSYRWDVDGDGIYEAEGPDADEYRYPGYQLEGNYEALFEAMDDKGVWGGDTLSVLVRPEDHNFKPTVLIDVENGTVLSGTYTVVGTADDDSGVEKVEVSAFGPLSSPSEVLPWTGADGRREWTYDWDTTTVPDGDYLFRARAYDGDRYSDISEVQLTVENPNHPPSIVQVIADPEELPLDGVSTLIVGVSVEDLDLPDEILFVDIDLSPMGGPSLASMLDDGGYPDDERGDGTYTIEFLPENTLEPGVYELAIYVEDEMGATDTTTASVSLVRFVDVFLDLSAVTVERGERIEIEVRVQPYSIDNHVFVMADFIEGGRLEMEDNGGPPDKIAGDGVYTGYLGTDALSGEYGIEVRVETGGGAVLWSDTVDIKVVDVKAPTSGGDEGGGVHPALIMLLVFVVLVILAGAAMALNPRLAVDLRSRMRGKGGNSKKQGVREVPPPAVYEAVEVGS